MNPFRGCSSLCAAALVGALLAAPAAYADLPGATAGDTQAGQQLVSDITVLTALNRMRLTQGQMRDIVQRLSQLSHAEETYAEHETNTSATALAAMRQVEKALQDGQEVDPAAQAKVDAILNPLKAEGTKVDQLRDETINGIERELRPEQLAALMDALGIQGQRQAATNRWNYAIQPDNAITPPPAGGPDVMPGGLGGAPAAPGAQPPRLLDLGLPEPGQPLEGQPDAFGPKDGARILDEGKLREPQGVPAIPQGAATPPAAARTAPPPAARTAPPPAPAGSAAPIIYGGGDQQVYSIAAPPLTADVQFYTLAATAPAAVTSVQLLETPPAPAGPEVGTGAAPANPNAEADQLKLEEAKANLDADQARQQAQIADLEQRLQKLNAQTMNELKMIQQMMGQLHVAQGQANIPPVGIVEMPNGEPAGLLAMPAPQANLRIMMEEPGYTVGGGFAVQRSYGGDAVRRFFLQPNVLRFLKARLANQQ